jgi:hypothetical protein
MFRIKDIVGLLFYAFTLSACGGGGDSPSTAPTPASTAEGLWNGTTSSGRTGDALVLDDGTYWVIYSLVGNSSVIAGAAQGNSASNNGTFSSSDGIDFNLEGFGINSFSLSGTYTPKSKLSGTITYPSNTSYTFTGTYDTDYDLTPSLATIAGTYVGTAATLGGIESATATITDTGAMSGRGASGCTYTGNASARPNGNVYNISVTFEGGICSNGTATVTGVAYFNAKTNQLIAAALNSDRTNGFLGEGIKQ